MNAARKARARLRGLFRSRPKPRHRFTAAEKKALRGELDMPKLMDKTPRPRRWDYL